MLVSILTCLLGILTALGFSAVSALIDVEHIAKNEYIQNHVSRWILRMYFFMAMGTQHISWALGSALIFTAVFDQFINLGMSKPFWYRGKVASWDKFFNRKYIVTPDIKLRGKIIVDARCIRFNFSALYVIVKVSCLIGGVYLFTCMQLDCTLLLDFLKTFWK